MAAEDIFHATSLGPTTAPTIRKLADLKPTQLAITMHGSSFSGDGSWRALRALADHYARRVYGQQLTVKLQQSPRLPRANLVAALGLECGLEYSRGVPLLAHRVVSLPVQHFPSLSGQSGHGLEPHSQRRAYKIGSRFMGRRPNNPKGLKALARYCLSFRDHPLTLVPIPITSSPSRSRRDPFLRGYFQKVERERSPRAALRPRARAAPGISHAGTTAGAGGAVPGLGQVTAGNARLDPRPRNHWPGVGGRLAFLQAAGRVLHRWSAERRARPKRERVSNIRSCGARAASASMRPVEWRLSALRLPPFWREDLGRAFLQRDGQTRMRMHRETGITLSNSPRVRGEVEELSKATRMRGLSASLGALNAQAGGEALTPPSPRTRQGEGVPAPRI